MPRKNLEEAIVDRIRRALAKELKRTRRKAEVGNGPVTGPASDPEVKATDVVTPEAPTGTA